MNEPPQMNEDELDAYIEGLRAMARSQVREDAIFPLSNWLREHAFGPDYSVVANYPRRFVFGSGDVPLLVDFQPGHQEPVSFEAHHEDRVVMKGVLVAGQDPQSPGTYYGDGADICVTQWERGPWEELLWGDVERVEILNEGNSPPET